MTRTQFTTRQHRKSLTGRQWAKLTVLPFAQAIFSGALVIALSWQWFTAAWIVGLALNLCWWQNIQMTHETRGIPAAGVVYSLTITTGTVLGAWLLAMLGQ